MNPVSFDKVRQLLKQGVRIPNPESVEIGQEVDLDRIQGHHITIHAGCKIFGSATLIMDHATLGYEAPVTVDNCQIGPEVQLKGGFFKDAVFLQQASASYGAHVREGTIFEEQANIAHTVGLKQTILFPFVTLGSLINFCDCLMAGGTSRKDHAEVGSGYIHFNFTPWGKRGDKATPSLIGDVPRGVFLRERRIFLGGTGGLVGPAEVGYGAVAGAGQVVRNGIKEGRLVIQQVRALDRPVEMNRLDPITPRANRNVRYIANLFALCAWYRQVRLPQAPEARRPVISAAARLIDDCIDERIKQLGRFIEERGGTTPTFTLDDPPPCPLPIGGEHPDHVAWVKSLSDEEVTAGVAWLESIVEEVSSPALEQLS